MKLFNVNDELLAIFMPGFKSNYDQIVDVVKDLYTLFVLLKDKTMYLGYGRRKMQSPFI